MGSGVLIDGASWVYINAQTTVTLGALVLIYLFRNQSFYFVRNMIMVAMVVALVGYIALPDRAAAVLPRVGLLRLASATSPASRRQRRVNALFNPYAAVPSMHVAFALMIGWSLARLVRNRVRRVRSGGHIPCS